MSRTTGGEPVGDTLRQAWLDYRRMLDEALLEIRELRTEKEHLTRRLMDIRRHVRARALPLAIMLEAASQMGLSQKAYVTMATPDSGDSHE